MSIVDDYSRIRAHLAELEGRATVEDGAALTTTSRWTLVDCLKKLGEPGEPVPVVWTNSTSGGD